VLIYPSGELPQGVALSIVVVAERDDAAILVARSTSGTIYGLALVGDGAEHVLARAVWCGQLGSGELVGDTVPAEWLLNG